MMIVVLYIYVFETFTSGVLKVHYSEIMSVPWLNIPSENCTCKKFSFSKTSSSLMIWKLNNFESIMLDGIGTNHMNLQ